MVLEVSKVSSIEEEVLEEDSVVVLVVDREEMDEVEDATRVDHMVNKTETIPSASLYAILGSNPPVGGGVGGAEAPLLSLCRNYLRGANCSFGATCRYT